MKITFAKPSDVKSGPQAVFVAGKTMSPTARALDEASGGALSKAIKASRFTGNKGDFLDVLAPSGVAASRIVLVGAGRPSQLTAADFEAVGAGLYARLARSGEKGLTVSLDDLDGCPVEAGVAAAHIGAGLRLRSYRFDKYLTKEPKSKKPSLTKAKITTSADRQAKAAFAPMDGVIDGVFLTRDLVSEPANILHPESYADRANELAEHGIDVEVLGEKKMRKLGMGALLGVGQGSVRESKLVIMRYMGADDPEAQPLAFIGKGVTFDTGGISLKPPAGMEDMKWDMGGSAIVVGLMKALARRKAKVNVVGVVGLVENMPGGNAQRPGDIVTSMSGQTIEVLNTDAEGRLVLADAMWYTQDKFKPKFMVDLATLTGAIIIALGHEYAGFYSDSEKLAKELHAAGATSGDKVWRMPLADGYDKMINSPAADMKNIGGRPAGSITAAQFLKRFTNGVPWAHIDVAGMVWSDKDGATWEKGATGFGVRLLDRFVAENYE